MALCYSMAHCHHPPPCKQEIDGGRDHLEQAGHRRWRGDHLIGGMPKLSLSPLSSSIHCLVVCLGGVDPDSSTPSIQSTVCVQVYVMCSIFRLSAGNGDGEGM